MDIEQLTKSQIILLTLLVSFMTSIATGIVTVSLMQQAPPTVVQSVSRIIRQTVGQMASTTHAIMPAAAATPVQTVVVRDSDVIAQGVARASRSLVRMYARDPEHPAFLGMGSIVNDSGLIVVDESALGENSDVDIKHADGSYMRAFVTRRDQKHGVAFLSEATSTAVISFGNPIGFSTNGVKLGDIVVALGGVSVDRMRAGYMIAFLSDHDTGSVAVLETDIPQTDIVSGAPLIDGDGKFLGISTDVSRAISGGAFIPVSAIQTLLTAASGP